MTSPSSLPSSALLQRLRSFVDSRLGVPPTTERPAPVGPAVVALKRGFRRAFQPLINEVLDRQARFNSELLDWGRAVTRDIESIERSMTALRSSVDLRLARLEAIASRLEALDGKNGESAEAPRRTRGKNSHDKV